ncbi:hypothetical protein IG631_14395 [Alternaria alternata]|nr:hypothetical protein IG631_14395 [Alternaria alternata]
MKPRRSRSRDSDRTMGELGGPARTVVISQSLPRLPQLPQYSPTTSLLAPLLARGARRLRLYFFCSLHTRKLPVPTKATIAAVKARFLDTQSCRRCR